VERTGSVRELQHGVARNGVPRQGAAQDVAQDGGRAPIRVLVADDDETVRSGFRLMLGIEHDIEVVGDAATGVHAVEMARRLCPDVVLVDIRMPGLDGLAATRAIVGRPDPPRVVVVTTFDLDEYVYGALRAGACGFLLKDAGPTLLVEAVRAAVNGDALVSPSVTVRLLQHLPAGPGEPSSACRRPQPGRDRGVGLAERPRPPTRRAVRVGRGLSGHAGAATGGPGSPVPRVPR
jgi:DNA-binding NarL/FixJ family response regulator